MKIPLDKRTQKVYHNHNREKTPRAECARIIERCRGHGTEDIMAAKAKKAAAIVDPSKLDEEGKKEALDTAIKQLKSSTVRAPS